MTWTHKRATTRRHTPPPPQPPPPAPPAAPLAKRAVSAREAAELLSCGVALVYKLCRTGELRSIRNGYKLIIPVSAIDAWLESAAASGEG